MKREGEDEGGRGGGGEGRKRREEATEVGEKGWVQETYYRVKDLI